MNQIDSKQMYIIVGMTQDHVIGKDNTIPWHIPGGLEDL